VRYGNPNQKTKGDLFVFTYFLRIENTLDDLSIFLFHKPAAAQSPKQLRLPISPGFFLRFQQLAFSELL